VRVRHGDDGYRRFELLDDNEQPVVIVSEFLEHLRLRGCSPNTVSAYAYDLLHFFRFLAGRGLSWPEFRPPHALEFLKHLRSVTARRPRQRLGLAVVSRTGPGVKGLAPESINRALTAVSSFYEYLILAGELGRGDNPIQVRPDPALARVSERHRPALGSSSRQRPVRRSVRVKTTQRLPRPLSPEQLDALLSVVKNLRDKAAIAVMYEGGLRPGEVLGLRLEDIDYSHRRVVVRWREDHPKGVRSKSRSERVVDLYEGRALAALNAYVMNERPQEAETPLVFLISRRGAQRAEPLSYAGFVRAFARATERAGIREPWVTPHALRHSHATRMWELGMRELTLQRRLGHASPESTRIYTRVSDPQVVDDYRRAVGG
jgi:integrase